MPRYLITGIAGFIGSALAHALLSQGHEVRGLDNLSTGKRENISDILKQIDFREADLLDEAAMASACHNIDFVLHQAALPSVVSSVKDPMTTHRSNTDGTLNLLLAARNGSVKRVVYASSCSAYGDAPLPNKEEMMPQPLSPYAVSKVTGEFYMNSFHKVYGLETLSLRYFNVFGPRQDANSEYSAVIAKFVTLMLEDKRPVIFGDGEQSRDFTYVENVVAANMLACAAPAAAVVGRTFNIGMGEPVTINQAYRSIQALAKFPEGPAYDAARSGEIRHSFADISLARERLGYAPIVTFEQGLNNTVDWYLAETEKASAKSSS